MSLLFRPLVARVPAQASAHNKSVSDEARKHSAEEYCRMHEERTGVKVRARDLA